MLVAAAVALVAIWWLDHVVMVHQLPFVGCTLDIPSPCSASNPSGYDPQLAYLGYLATAGVALVLARLAWWSRSAAVGTIYLVVGGLFALLPLIHPDNGLDPHAITPLRDFVQATGEQRNLLAVLGGAMALVGILVIVRSLLDWVAADERDSGTGGQAL